MLPCSPSFSELFKNSSLIFHACPMPTLLKKIRSSKRITNAQENTLCFFRYCFLFQKFLPFFFRLQKFITSSYNPSLPPKIAPFFAVIVIIISEFQSSFGLFPPIFQMKRKRIKKLQLTNKWFNSYVCISITANYIFWNFANVDIVLI